MAMRKRADGIVPLCNLAAPRKDERVRGGRGIAPGMAGGDPQARGIASRSSSTASPKGKPRRRRWGFLCPTKVEYVLVGGALRPSPQTASAHCSTGHSSSPTPPANHLNCYVRLSRFDVRDKRAGQSTSSKADAGPASRNVGNFVIFG